MPLRLVVAFHNVDKVTYVTAEEENATNLYLVSIVVKLLCLVLQGPFGFS